MQVLVQWKALRPLLPSVETLISLCATLVLNSSFLGLVLYYPPFVQMWIVHDSLDTSFDKSRVRDGVRHPSCMALAWAGLERKFKVVPMVFWSNGCQSCRGFTCRGLAGVYFAGFSSECLSTQSARLSTSATVGLDWRTTAILLTNALLNSRQRAATASRLCTC